MSPNENQPKPLLSQTPEEASPETVPSIPQMGPLPCPWCNNAPRVESRPAPVGRWWKVLCSGALCGDGPICQIQPSTNGLLSREAAVLEWNTRKAPSAEPQRGTQDTLPVSQESPSPILSTVPDTKEEEKPNPFFGQHIREAVNAFRPLFRKKEAAEPNTVPGPMEQGNFLWLRDCYSRLKAHYDDQRRALKRAVEIIKIWHGEVAWPEYQHSPEMREINAALASWDAPSVPEEPKSSSVSGYPEKPGFESGGRNALNLQRALEAEKWEAKEVVSAWTVTGITWGFLKGQADAIADAHNDSIRRLAAQAASDGKERGES